MGDQNEQTTPDRRPAVWGPVQQMVRPRAWVWIDQPSGREVYSGWLDPRPTETSKPLYDQAALDAAVAAERERWQRVAEAAQAVTADVVDRIGHFEVPSYLMAALALALDDK